MTHLFARPWELSMSRCPVPVPRRPEHDHVGTGALVVFAPAAMIGVEITVSPEGRPDGRVTRPVRAHRAAPGPERSGEIVYAAVYPALAPGRWQLWHPHGPVALTVRVDPDELVEVSWPGRPDSR